MCDVCKADICFLDIRIWIWEFLLLSKTVCSWGDSKEAGTPHFNEAAHWKDHAVLFEFYESVMIEKNPLWRSGSIFMGGINPLWWYFQEAPSGVVIVGKLWITALYWQCQFGTWTFGQTSFLPSSWHSVIRRWRIDLENIWRFYFFKSSILLQAAFMNSIEEGSFQMLKTKCKNFVITGCRRGFHWILSKHRFRIWNFFPSFKMTRFLIILIEECYFTTSVYRIEAL